MSVPRRGRISTYSDILTAVKATIGTVTIQGVGPDQIRIRKKPVYLAEHDTLPLVVVSPLQEGVEMLTYDNFGVFLFPVLVTIIQETGVNWESLEWLLDAREDIRQALHKTTLSGVSSVFDCDYDPRPTYDMTGLNAGFDVSMMSFSFKSQEARSV